MGFVVNCPIITIDNRTFDSFYVRIENYQVNKYSGSIFISVAHYIDSNAAKIAFGEYMDSKGDPSGMLPASYSYDGTPPTDKPMFYTFDIGQEVIVPTIIDTVIYTAKNIDYIDFDSNGDEVVLTKIEQVETIESNIVNIPRRIRTISIDNNDIYTFGYNKIRETYIDIFGVDKIIDDI
jgi:hypothetical protein